MGVSDPEIRVDRHFQDSSGCSIFYIRPDGDLGSRGPVAEGASKKEEGCGFRMGETLRLTLDLNEGTLYI